jgi:branched-chain amino acid transport system permease protein
MIMNILQMLVDGLSSGTLYVLLALGLSLVFSVMGLINFAYGSLIVWAGYSLYALNLLGLPYPLCLAGMALSVTVLSLVMGRVAFLPFVGAAPSTLLLASFGVALALQAVAIMIFGEAPRAVPTPAFLITSIDLGIVRVSVIQLVALALGAAVLIGLDLLIKKTRYGMEMRAAAEDAATARLLGVRSSRVLTLVFALSGLIAAVVALVWLAQIGTVTPRGDFNPTLKAFIAVVLGGLGTVRGAVIGGLMLGMLESVLSATLDAPLINYQQTLAFVLVILILLIRPQGIAGRTIEVSK